MEQQLDVNQILQKLSNKLAEAHLNIALLETRLEMQASSERAEDSGSDQDPVGREVEQ